MPCQLAPGHASSRRAARRSQRPHDTGRSKSTRPTRRSSSPARAARVRFQREHGRERQHVPVRDSDPEHETERVVNGANLRGIESPRRGPEALRINDGRLLGEHTSLPSAEIHGRTKTRRTRARRGRRNKNGAQAQKLVSLHDDRIARAALLTTASASQGRQPEDLATDHQSGSGGARSAICSRISRISSRSSESATRRRTSSAIDDRTRRRAAASRNAVRTASESLRPLERTTSSAAAALSSRRTWRERAATAQV
jgi:hypothetical protein